MPAQLIGSRLRDQRLHLGLRQSDVAKSAAISASYLNLIEHNRRNVTGDVLERLAETLQLNLAVLRDTSPNLLASDLRSAAARVPQHPAELDKIDDFTSRFPGWAALLVAHYGRVSTLERAVEALNDRLGHDPSLSAALHELLSAMAGVRSTATILVETEDLTPDWQRRFHQNLHQDSERLAEGAERLVAYLDRSDQSQSLTAVSPQDEMEDWLDARGWQPGSAEEDIDSALFSLSPAARVLAKQQLDLIAEDAAYLPSAAFEAAFSRLGGDPALLAQDFGVTVIRVMRRMAMWPGAEAGLVLCDASGTILLRKSLRGFAVPRFGAACPIWPLFQALARPGQPLNAVISTAEGEDFLAQSFCETAQPFGFHGPETRLAAMLLRPREAGMNGARHAHLAQIPVGSTCRICARNPCPARREPSILL